ncbi:transposase [Halorubrum sp. SD626R]|uniref:transposase n=1 Tax=Halorubrum sp. SD626R TaxID=1419722 RepID=UPI00373FE077
MSPGRPPSSGSPALAASPVVRCVRSRPQRTVGSELYGQRWMAETAFSAIKRRFGPAVHPRAWYREFRELVLTAAVYNLEQALKQ